jgi:hypothetical protein
MLTALIFTALLSVSFESEMLFGFNEISGFSDFQVKLFVMFLLAEPHFAMTIPLLWGYRDLFRSQKLLFIYLPIIISTVSLYLFFEFTVLFTLIFLVANIYHVNRQSVGFLKLQGAMKNRFTNIYEVLLHLFASLAVLNKTFLVINTAFTSLIFLIIFFIFSAIAFFAINKEQLTAKNALVISQGFLIFFPLLLFDDIILAFAVGISIHYIQYLLISWKVCLNSFKFSAKYLVFFLAIYSITTTNILSGSFSSEKLSLLIFIPTLLQLLHFYFDSLIWRRTQPVVRQKLSHAKI